MNYFVKKNDKIVLNVPSAIAYVPVEYLDSGLLTDFGGEYYKVLGLFYIDFFSDTNATKKILNTRIFNIPTEINIYPVSNEIKDVEINGVTEKYFLFKFLQNNAVTDVFIIQSSKAVESFASLLEAGKLPKVPYDKVYDIWTTNMRLNNVLMSDVPSSSREMMVAEKYRDKSNPSLRFGIKVGKNPKISMYDYITVNARTLTKYSSTFAGITFEDFDSMVINGLIVSKSGRKQIESPIEKTIKY